ncbi:hypothetical protein RUMGNA_02897 [Mediterraneibacter gnavus ATCC 29149]|uniref:Uncharacterized protein n=1 Tax=Mediterraneibacter gnavus (strain ATCC 29149 / DSM 114966 / JCM 6515 / VPI C7-9) TaxID=411470 RepID=A7B5Q7_MEDG7|nr:hypothetical protein RUMGNA_02897 [Mediterraneibacter gnavus ATCC 29149]
MFYFFQNCICGCGGIGRRAGFRVQWASRAGSSPVIRRLRRSLDFQGFFACLGRVLLSISELCFWLHLITLSDDNAFQ